MSRGGAYQRYQIVDEPRRPPLARVAIPPLILLPVTIGLALFFSMFFWLLPGLNGLLVSGNHRWRDIGLSVLALCLFVCGLIIIGMLRKAGLLPGFRLEYAKDFVLALTVFPLIKVMLDQEHTRAMREVLRS